MPIDLEYPALVVGAGVGVMAAPATVRRDREYALGPTGYGAPGIPQALGVGFDSLTQTHGLKVYESMLCDPAVSGSFDVLRLGVLSTGLQLAPAVTAEPGVDPATDPRAATAMEVKELCERAIKACDSDFDAVAFELLEALAFGNRLAEITWRVVETGPDKGRLFPARVKPKPKGGLEYVVDSTNEILSIRAVSAETGSHVLLPPEKFVRFTWSPKDGDPRGSSVLRPAFDAWSLKIQVWPEYFASLQQFGSPSLIGITAESEPARLPEDDDGNPIEGSTPISPQAALAERLSKFRNGRAIALPFGTSVTVVGGQGNGEAFRLAVDLFNREIALAILKNTRTTLESKHGSKADGEVGQDVTGLTISWARRSLARVIRDQLLWAIVSYNLGPEVADEFTPTVTFGDAEQQDIPAVAKAVADLMRASYFTEAQLPHMDARLGIPPRSPGEARVATATKPEPDPKTGEDAADPNAEDDKEPPK